MEPLIPLFWTSDDFASGFQSQNEQPYLPSVEAYVIYVPRDSPHVQFIFFIIQYFDNETGCVRNIVCLHM